MRFFIKFNLLFVAVLALACATIQAQSPSVSTRPAHQLQAHPEVQGPIGCVSYCVWYSGDIDFSNENWGGLYNGYTPNNDGAFSQIWVPFAVNTGNKNGWNNAVKITSITFNELTENGNTPNVTNMTYAFKGYIFDGGAGANYYSGSCNYVQPVATGRANNSYTEYAFTCKLPTPAILLNGYIDWVNVYPTISNASGLFLSNVTDNPQPNHVGWGDTLSYSFINSSYFSYNYLPATDYDVNDTEFSVGMTGTYLHVNPKLY